MSHQTSDISYYNNKEAIWLPIPEGAEVEVGVNGELGEFDLWQWVQSVDWKKLAEIADLDNLIGFKGNYMIFPSNRII